MPNNIVSELVTICKEYGYTNDPDCVYVMCFCFGMRFLIVMKKLPDTITNEHLNVENKDTYILRANKLKVLMIINLKNMNHKRNHVAQTIFVQDDDLYGENDIDIWYTVGENVCNDKYDPNKPDYHDIHYFKTVDEAYTNSLYMPSEEYCLKAEEYCLKSG
jgi:hypothetical protein